MYDAPAPGAADTLQRRSAMCQQSISQRAAAVSGGGMHDHACRFFNDQQMLVFKNNFQWYRFWQ